MKKTFIFLALSAAVVAGSGCAGLHVQWAASATYNSTAVTSATLTPGVPPPAVRAAP